MSTFSKKKMKSSKTVSSTNPTLGPQSLHQRIADCAYGLFLNRGKIHGHNLNDWLEAERMVLDKVKSREKGRS